MNAPLFQASPVPKLATRPVPPRRPHDVVVYATRGGELHVLEGGKPLRWRDQMFSQYAVRFEVNMADQQRMVRLGQSPPPSAEGVYNFDVTLTVGFRVFDPLEVVRRNVHDALPMLYSHLIRTAHEVTSRYSIEQAGQAAAALNAYFQREEVVENCLLVYKCWAQVAPEAAYKRHHRDRAESRMTIGDREAEHELSLVETGNQINLDLLKQQGRMIMAQHERAALAGRPLDARELIAIAMERGELTSADAALRLTQLDQLEAQAAANAQIRHDNQVKLFAEKGLLGRSDMVELLGTPAPGPPVGMPPPQLQPARPSWNDPLPQQQSWQPPQQQAPFQPPAARTLVPVYIVLDQSVAGHLGGGIQALVDALAAQPDIAAAVRLSVLGYADRVEPAVRLQAVQAGMRLPWLAPAVGTRYGAVFEDLLDSLPRDAAALKAQSATVYRPQVIFLSAAQPQDHPDWVAIHRRLVDRAAHPTAPDIIACGIGDAHPGLVAGIATRPELAFVAGAGDVAGAVERFCDFTRRHVLGYGRAVIEGAGGPVVIPPDGYRPAGELL